MKLSQKLTKWIEGKANKVTDELDLPAPYTDQLCFESHAYIAQATAEKIFKDFEPLVGVLEELRDLMEDVRTGNYSPDSFTNQPANHILTELKEKGYL